MVRIAEIVPGSIAEELRLAVGSRLVRMNGVPVRDQVDFRYHEAEDWLELEVAPAEGGDAVLYEIEKDPGEALGIIPAADVVRQCANKCVFCFVDGNPLGARQALHLKDDDFRLSFTYGSYVTLTNLGPKGFQRLIDQRLSPLYVSVHATEPEVRERLLGVPLGGGVLEQLGRLTAAGIDVHTQVVLCPEWNDGPHLDRTLDDLWALGPGVLSLSVVPVGLTQYNLDRPVRLLTPAECATAVRQVERARSRSRRERGHGWAYAGDELFFLAGEPLPGAAYYDDWPLTENGVGAVRRLLDDFEAGVAAVPRRSGERILVVTGVRMAPVLEPLAARLAAVTGALVEVVAVENTMFGPTVNTAGLLPGVAIRDAVAERLAGRAAELVLLPAEALNDDGRFVDDVALADIQAALAPARVAAGFELTSLLGAP
jgi:putative radical SAM enzyme (TIGR03279 family)